MKNLQHVTELTDNQITEIINKWSNSKFFSIKNLGNEIDIYESGFYQVFKIEFTSQYEYSWISHETEPYNSQGVTSVAIVEGSERIENCPVFECNFGTVTCKAAFCYYGKINCGLCGGLGYNVETEVRWSGADRSEARVRKQCYICSGLGKLECSVCNGKGHVKCSTCGGSGKVYTFDKYNSRIDNKSVTKYCNSTSLEDGFLAKAKGENIISQRSERITYVTPINSEVDKNVNHIIQEVTSASGTHILMQQLLVTCIPVHQVSFRYYQLLEEQTCWIYGKQNLIHFTKYPLNQRKIRAVVGTVLAFFFLITLASVLVWVNRPSPSSVIEATNILGEVSPPWQLCTNSYGSGSLFTKTWCFDDTSNGTHSISIPWTCRPILLVEPLNRDIDLILEEPPYWKWFVEPSIWHNVHHAEVECM